MAPLVGERRNFKGRGECNLNAGYRDVPKKLYRSVLAISGPERPKTCTDPVQIFRMPQHVEFVGNWEVDEDVERRVVELN
mgnify:CR=1 FL=1